MTLARDVHDIWQPVGLGASVYINHHSLLPKVALSLLYRLVYTKYIAHIKTLEDDDLLIQVPTAYSISFCYRCNFE